MPNSPGASCERASDLLVTGGCYADPQWMAQLVATRPVGITDNAAAASKLATA